MAIYKTAHNELWDDMDGTAIDYDHWPKDAVEITEEEAAVIRQQIIDSLPKIKDMTIEEKLANIGLSKEDLKSFLT
jgi:hypothetical protein